MINIASISRKFQIKIKFCLSKYIASIAYHTLLPKQISTPITIFLVIVITSSSSYLSIIFRGILSLIIQLLLITKIIHLLITNRNILIYKITIICNIFDIIEGLHKEIFIVKHISISKCT